MILLTAISLLVLVILGVPVSFAIMLSGLLGLVFGGGIPGVMAVQQMIRGINSFSMMAGPLFILAGEILGSAKLSEKILNFSKSLVSWMRGGLGAVCVLANMIFAGISGSGAATMSAVGGLTSPELIKEGYDRSFVASLIAGSGALGPIIPPSVNMIVYASLTGFSVGKLFLGGLVPGAIIGIALMVMCNIYARKHDIDKGTGSFEIKVVWKSFKDAFFALITPIIIIGGVISGIFTATESGVIACIYALICGLFIYRTIKLRDLVGIFKRSAASSAMLLMIMGTANIYGYIFAMENVGGTIQNFLLSISQNPTVIVGLILLIMIAIGCFMETIAAMVVILPVVYPLVMQLGVDPLLFGVLFSIATVIGGLTPPVGLYLFLSMDITKAPFVEAIRYTLPVVGIIILTMVMSMIFPGIVTWLPNLMIAG